MTRCDPTFADLHRGVRTTVVVGVSNNDAPDDALLSTAAAEAERRAHVLRIVHVAARDASTSTRAVPVPGSVQRSDAPGARYWSDAVLRRHPYLEVNPVTMHGDPAHPARALADASRDAALLVVGHRPRGTSGVDRTLLDLMDAAPCPVLVVPAGLSTVSRAGY